MWRSIAYNQCRWISFVTCFNPNHLWLVGQKPGSSCLCGKFKLDHNSKRSPTPTKRQFWVDSRIAEVDA